MPNYFVESDPSEVVLNSGLAQLDTDTAMNYIKLAADASSVDNAYNGHIVEIIDGTGSAQARYIVDYIGASHIAYIAGWWAVKPDTTSEYRVVNRTLIMEGEVPTPSVLNRPYFSLLDNDLNLENVIQFLTRSTVLQTNSSTKFLAHFKGNGTDTISGLLPETPNYQYNPALYIDDNIFYGSVWPQDGGVKNLISTCSPSIDPSLHNISNWVVSKSSNVDVAMANGVSGVRYSTIGKESPSNGGTIKVATPNFSLAGLTGKLSLSMQYSDLVNFAEEGTSLNFGVEVYNSSNALISTIELMSNSLTRSAGRLELNNQSMPANANYGKAFFIITYPNGASIDITLSNFSVENMSYSHTFIATTRNEAIDVTYNNVVKLAPSSEFSLFCWIRPREQVFLSKTSDFGPIFIEASNGSIVGIVNTAAKRGLKSLSLVSVNTNNDIDISSSIDFGGSWDTYIPILLRGKIASNGSGILEFCLIDSEGRFQKTSLQIASTSPLYNLKLGFSSKYATHFDCPLTEVRYDTEWWNDLEFRLVAIAAHPFGKPILAASIDDLAATNTFTNLVTNPDGKLGANYWQSIDNFDASYDDVIGYHLKYTRTSTLSELSIPQLLKVSVVPGTQITLKALMGTKNLTGNAGIYLSFYAGANPLHTYYKYADAATLDAYQELTCTVPETSNLMEIGLVVGTGSISAGGYVRWTQIKAERSGVASSFSKESTPAYAVYAS